MDFTIIVLLGVCFIGVIALIIFEILIHLKKRSLEKELSKDLGYTFNEKIFIENEEFFKKKYIHNH